MIRTDDALAGRAADRYGHRRRGGADGYRRREAGAAELPRHEGLLSGGPGIVAGSVAQPRKGNA